MTRQIPWLTALLLAGVSVSATTIPLISDTFEDYTVDEILPKAATNARGPYAYENGPDTIKVKSDTMSGLLGAENKVVKIQREAAKGGSYLDVLPISREVLSFDQLAEGKLSLVISFDIKVSGENKNLFYVAIRSQSGMQNLATLYFKPEKTGSASVGYAVVGQEEVDTKERINAGTWYRVVCDIRQNAEGKWAFTAKVTEKSTNESIILVDNALLQVDQPHLPSLNRIRFYQFGSEGVANSSEIDDLSVVYSDDDASTVAPAAAVAPAASASPATTSSSEPGIKILEESTITDEKSGYAAWPTVALLPNDELLVIASAGRDGHACPFGKHYLYRSKDLGKSWEGPTKILEGKLDARGCSLMRTSKGTLLAGGFSSITWLYLLDNPDAKLDMRKIEEHTKHVTLEDFKNEAGFWMLRSTDNGVTWAKEKTISDSPHGPTELQDGSLLFVGYEPSSTDNMNGGRPSTGGLIAAKSTDDGQTWKVISRLPVAPGHRSYQYHEPHAVQAVDGTIIVHIRKSYPKTAATLQTTSRDGGVTWTPPTEVYWGYPSHLLKLKNGNLLATYGYRRAPLGIRASTSLDNGKTWGKEFVIYDKAKSGDMGYPSTVELSDGSLFTVWYETKSPTETVLRSARWQIQNHL